MTVILRFGSQMTVVAGIGILGAGAALLNWSDTAADQAQWLCYSGAAMALIGIWIFSRNKRTGTVQVMTVLGLILLVNVIASRHSVRADLTSEGRNSLNPETIHVLEGLKRPVIVLAAHFPSIAEQIRITDLLHEYNRHSTLFRIDARGFSTGTARYEGVSRPTELVLESGGERLPALVRGERDLTQALIRTTADAPVPVYFSAHTGGRDPLSDAPDGYSIARRLLEKRRYAVRLAHLDEIDGIDRKTQSAWIIADLKTPLSDAESDAIGRFLRQGGRMLLALGPDSEVPNPELLHTWGLRLRDDVVIDSVSSLYHFAAAPLVTQYGEHPIVATLSDPVTCFPDVRSIQLLDPIINGVIVEPLAWSGPSSRSSSTASEDSQFATGHAGDGNTRLSVVAAARDLKWGGRIVVFGSSEFMSNEFLRAAGSRLANADLFLNALDWLTEDERLSALEPEPYQVRSFELNRLQLQLIQWACTLLYPLVVLAVGAARWWASGE